MWKRYFQEFRSLPQIVEQELGQYQAVGGHILAILALTPLPRIVIGMEQYISSPTLAVWILVIMYFFAVVKRNVRLRSRLEARLEVLFDKGPKFHQSNNDYDLFRIEVKNTSEVTVREATTSLRDIEPYNHGYPDIPFQQWDDQNETWQQHFTLHPGTGKHLDIVRKEVGEDKPIQLCYATYRAAYTIPPGTYDLTIVTTGDNVPPRFRKFRVDINKETGRLTFEPWGESYGIEE